MYIPCQGGDIVHDFDFIISKGERTHNEDFLKIISTQDMTAFVLADGLGGQGYGDIASTSAVSAVEEYLLNNRFEGIETLKNCFASAQKGVLSAQNNYEYEQMRTTLVILVIFKERAFWGHIGDSRLYVFSGDSYEYRTKDHSVPQALCNMGEIKENEIRHHDERNKLLRALGSPEIGEDSLIEIGGENIDVKNKSFLLCTDGFWEWIEEKEMSRKLKSSSCADQWLSAMTNIVTKKGCGKNMDNFSAIAVVCR